ncbi:hypothetical protein SK128_019609 [Halocaridina rubra]|uniref:Uncharacterized protein n=1 Tax=Halocaridina rubra TaxID=373956 RepID=A0AAN9A8P6_HALRR
MHFRNQKTINKNPLNLIQGSCLICNSSSSLNINSCNNNNSSSNNNNNNRDINSSSDINSNNNNNSSCNMLFKSLSNHNSCEKKGYRGDLVTSSARSMGGANPRDSEASMKRKQSPYQMGQFQDFRTRDTARGMSLSDQNLSLSRKSTANISQLSSKGLLKDGIVPLQPIRSKSDISKPPTPVPQRSSRLLNRPKQSSFKQS